MTIKYLDRNCPYYDEIRSMEHGSYTIPSCKAKRMDNNTCIDCPIYKFPKPHTNVEEMRSYFENSII